MTQDSSGSATAEDAIAGAIPGPGLARIVARHAGREGPLLPILHDVQRAAGHISDAAVTAIAQALNLSRADVSGVVGFYHDFRRRPAKRPVLRLCGAEACQARGGRTVAAAARAAAGERVAVETVYCLGLCSVGPAALAGDAVHARLTPERVAALVAEIAR